MADQGPAAPAAPLRDPTVTAVCNLFLDHSLRANAPVTYEQRRRDLEDFCAFAGGLRVSELDGSHVAAWLDRHPTWKGYRSFAVMSVKRAFRWAADEGRIAADPLRRVRVPAPGSRERFLTPEERQAIFDCYPEGDPFRDFLFALGQTGCRPGEVMKVAAEHFDSRTGAWVLGEHKTRGKTGRPRVVVLTPAMVELTERLAALHPEGPLFRNRKGRPWDRHSVKCRFRHVRQKLGLGPGVVAYLYRHAVATDLLEAGVGIAQAAELLGHKDTKMLMRVYSKLRQRRDHLRQEITRAVHNPSGGCGGETPPGPPAGGP